MAVGMDGSYRLVQATADDREGSETKYCNAQHLRRDHATATTAHQE